jgi:thiamine pyrophosphokinase
MPAEGNAMRALVFANGEPVPRGEILPWGGPGTLVIAADGGAANALAAGFIPDTVIGDLDSIDPATLPDLKRRGSRFISHPVDKDRTDLELAVALALAEGATDVSLVAVLGRRPDMTLANVLLLASPLLRTPGVRTRIVDFRSVISLARPEAPLTVRGAVGDGLSLLPLEDSEGVTIEGCGWPLVDGTLRLGSTVGVSNTMTGRKAEVTLRRGMLLVVHRRAAAEPDAHRETHGVDSQPEAAP